MSSTAYIERRSFPSSFEMNDSIFNGSIDSSEKFQMQLMNQHKRMNECSDGVFDNSESISSNIATSPSSTLQEPHTSWRFYTSYDNGEWKRHCVPVYHSEEDILQNNKQITAVNKYDVPQIESSLRRMRLGRPALHESIQRRRMANENKVHMPQFGYQQKVSQHRGHHSEPSEYSLQGSSHYYGSSPTNYNLSNEYGARSNSISFPSSSLNYGVSNFKGSSNYGSSNNYGIFKDYGVISTDINIEDIKSKILSNKSKTKDFSEKVIVPTKYKTAEELSLENEKLEALNQAKNMHEDYMKNDESEMNYEKSLAIRKNMVPGRDVKVVIVNNDIDNNNRSSNNNFETVMDGSPAYVAQRVGKDMMKQMEKHVLKQFKDKFPILDSENAIKEKQEMYTETLNVWNEGKPHEERTICEAKYESNNPITGSQNITERIIHTNQDPIAFSKGNKLFHSFDGTDIDMRFNRNIDQEIGHKNLYKAIEPKVEIDTLALSNEKIIIPRKYKEAISSVDKNINFGETKTYSAINNKADDAISPANFPNQSACNFSRKQVSSISNANFVDDSDSVFRNFPSNAVNTAGDSTCSRIVHEVNGEKIIIPRKYQQNLNGGEMGSLQHVSGNYSLSNNGSSAIKHASSEFRSAPSVQYSKLHQEAIF